MSIAVNLVDIAGQPIDANGRTRKTYEHSRKLALARCRLRIAMGIRPSASDVTKHAHVEPTRARQILDDLIASGDLVIPQGLASRAPRTVPTPYAPRTGPGKSGASPRPARAKRRRKRDDRHPSWGLVVEVMRAERRLRRLVARVEHLAREAS